MYTKEAFIDDILREPIFVTLKEQVSASMFDCVVTAMGYAYSRGGHESFCNYLERKKNESIFNQPRAVTH